MLSLLSYLRRAAIVFVISLYIVCPGYTAEKDITLQWDESTDALALQSYKIYYYTTRGNKDSLNSADYAASYSLLGGDKISISRLTDPKSITIDKNNTQITLHFLDDRTTYYFIVTAVDEQGAESIPTTEVAELPRKVVHSPDTVAISGSDSGGGGGGCFIATAAFGSYLDPHVNVLRNFRDNYLLTNSPGKAFVNIYYRYSPPLADFIRKHETMKTATRWVLTPVVYCVEYPYIMAVFLIVPAGIGLVYRSLQNRAEKRTMSKFWKIQTSQQ